MRDFTLLLHLQSSLSPSFLYSSGPLPALSFPSAFSLLFLFFETESHSIAQASLELMAILLQSPKF